jgi:hypothetical protein
VTEARRGIIFYYEQQNSFNPVPDNPALRRLVPRPEVLLFTPSLPNKLISGTGTSQGHV